MTIPSEHCEVKLHGFRRTQEGAVVSFVIHPVEVPASLALDPLGTRYMLALARIGNDEEPVPPPPPKESAPQKGDTVRSERAKENYRQSPVGEQAVVRAALLPKDQRFCAWALNKVWPVGAEPLTEAAAADFIRERCCNSNSRKLIAEVPEYLDRFLAMEMEFKIAVGEMASPR